MAHIDNPSRRPRTETNGRARVLARRTFTAGALVLAAAPGGAGAQTPERTYRVAVWHIAEPLANLAADGLPRFRAFFQELHRRGFIEGVNLEVGRYTSEGRSDLYEATAREIIGWRPDVVFCIQSVGTRLLTGLAPTIPIVGPAFSDPVAAGLATSLARPGRNVTGFTQDGGIEVAGLRLQLIKEAIPTAVRVAYLTSRDAPADPSALEVLQQAALQLSVELLVIQMSGRFDEAAYCDTFTKLAAARVNALYVGPAGEHIANMRLIVDLAASAGLPAIFSYREFVDDGGLMAYGANLLDNYRKGGAYVARILKGEKPGNLPIQQPTTFDFVVNLKTAKALGITLPESIMIRATEVIE